MHLPGTMLSETDIFMKNFTAATNFVREVCLCMALDKPRKGKTEKPANEKFCGVEKFSKNYFHKMNRKHAQSVFMRPRHRKHVST